jgi:hypothetical protein
MMAKNETTLMKQLVKSSTRNVRQSYIKLRSHMVPETIVSYKDVIFKNKYTHWR